MKTLLTFLLLASLLPLAAQEREADKWKLVWSDEFDYTGLPDPAKWDYEEGFVRNRELQYYTRARKENARVEDGNLIIEGRREKFKNPAYKADGSGKNWKQKREFAEYTAASLITLNKASWKYGRIEVRAKLPEGKGAWPAIWMMGINRPQIGWPRCGEIDIMEFVGKAPNKVHGTVHFGNKQGKHASKGGRIQAAAPYADFHLYAIEWDEKKINVFFDDKMYFSFPIATATYEGKTAFDKPFYLLLNYAIGGSWGGPVAPNMKFPSKYLIDYVRVYQRKK